MLRMNNELPIVEMIQAEKHKTLSGFEGGTEECKRTPWSKKQSNKENTGYEQMHTPVQKNREPTGKISARGFAQTCKSPLAVKPSTQAQNHDFVYKAKEGKMASLKDLINDLPSAASSR